MRATADQQGIPAGPMMLWLVAPSAECSVWPRATPCWDGCTPHNLTSRTVESEALFSLNSLLLLLSFPPSFQLIIEGTNSGEDASDLLLQTSSSRASETQQRSNFFYSMVLPTPAIAQFSGSDGKSGTRRMEAATGGQRLQKAGAACLWPPPSDFVWRFRGGRSNDPTSSTHAAAAKSTDMIVRGPVLRDPSGQWHPWNYNDSDHTDSDGESGGDGGGGGCRGCRKILRGEGRGFEKGGPALEPQGVVALPKGELSCVLRHLPSGFFPFFPPLLPALSVLTTLNVPAPFLGRDLIIVLFPLLTPTHSHARATCFGRLAARKLDFSAKP